MTGVLRREEKKEKTQTRKDQVKMEAEIGGMQP